MWGDLTWWVKYTCRIYRKVLQTQGSFTLFCTPLTFLLSPSHLSHLWFSLLYSLDTVDWKMALWRLCKCFSTEPCTMSACMFADVFDMHVCPSEWNCISMLSVTASLISLTPPPKFSHPTSKFSMPSIETSQCRASHVNWSWKWAETVVSNLKRQLFPL